MADIPTGFARRLSSPSLIAVLLAVLTFTVGVRYGAFVAGGADSYGYLSQADLWTHGRVRVQEPLARQVPWPSADWTLSPLGYRPAFERNGDIVPIYPPGFPLTLALFQLVGGTWAQFLVVPLLGALGIWLTFRLGDRLNGPATGLLAAAWLATNPAFLYSLMSPMSDVPAMTWSLLAIVLLSYGSRAAAAVAGLIVGLAVMTRPILVPLAVLLLLWAAWDAARARSLAGSQAQRAALFAAGVVPGCVLIGWLFDHWYGSPLQSGYEPLSLLFAWSHGRSNAANYLVWMRQTLTPLAVVAIVAPVVARRGRFSGRLGRSDAIALTWVALALFAALFVTYSFYLPFDAWWYVRFLLPAYPLLLVLSAAVIATWLRRTPRRVGMVLLGLLCILVGASGLTTAVRRSAFALGQGELKYPQAARFVAARLPGRAVVVAKQHSGSVRYYAGRLTARYDLIAPEWLDRALDYLGTTGRPPYFLLEDWEEAQFRDRFGAQSAFGRLDWPPMAELRTASGGVIHLYAPRDRERYLRGEPVVTEQIR